MRVSDLIYKPIKTHTGSYRSIHGLFIPGRVDMGSGLLEIFVVIVFVVSSGTGKVSILQFASKPIFGGTHTQI